MEATTPATATGANEEQRADVDSRLDEHDDTCSVDAQLRAAGDADSVIFSFPFGPAADGDGDDDEEDEDLNEDEEELEGDESADYFDGAEDEAFADEDEEHDEEMEFVVNGTAGPAGSADDEEDDELLSFHPPHLRPSLFPDGDFTCAFGLFADQPVPDGLVECPPYLSRLTFRITQVGYAAVKTAFKSGGMRGLAKGKEWNALWGKLASNRNLQPYQRANHFPGTWQIGRKDNLSRHVMRQRRRVGDMAANLPLCYHMPEDRALLVAEFETVQVYGYRPLYSPPPALLHSPPVLKGFLHEFIGGDRRNGLIPVLDLYGMECDIDHVAVSTVLRHFNPVPDSDKIA